MSQIPSVLLDQLASRLAWNETQLTVIADTPTNVVGPPPDTLDTPTQPVKPSQQEPAGVLLPLPEKEGISGATEAKIIKHLATHGVKVDSLADLPVAGRGMMGVALQVGDKILKLTKDETEAQASNQILKLQPKSDVFTEYFDVFAFTTLRGNTLYGIVQEKLEKPEADWSEFASEWFHFRNVDVKRLNDEYKKTGAPIDDAAWESAKGRFETPITVDSVLIFTQWLSDVQHLDISGKYKEKLQWLMHVANELARAKIQYRDLKGDNLMRRGARHVIIDLGVSKSGTAKIPVISRLQLALAADTPAKLPDAFRQDKFLAKAPNGAHIWAALAEAIGFNPKTSPHVLGHGSRASAYDVGSGKALKITNDETDALALATARDHPDPYHGVARVERVFLLDGGPGLTGYAILMEKLAPPDPAWADMVDMWPAGTHIDPDTVRAFFDKVKTPAKHARNWPAFATWLAHLGRYLDSVNIKFSDLWAENIMKNSRGGHSIVDLGYSVSPGKIMDLADDTLAEVDAAADSIEVDAAADSIEAVSHETEAGLPALLLPLLLQTLAPSALPDRSAPQQQVLKQAANAPKWAKKPHDGLRLGLIGGVGVSNFADVDENAAKAAAELDARTDLSQQLKNIVLVALDQTKDASASLFKEKIRAKIGNRLIGSYPDEYEYLNKAGKPDGLNPKTIYVRIVLDVEVNLTSIGQELKSIGMSDELCEQVVKNISDSIANKVKGMVQASRDSDQTALLRLFKRNGRESMSVRELEKTREGQTPWFKEFLRQEKIQDKKTEITPEQLEAVELHVEHLNPVEHTLQQMIKVKTVPFSAVDTALKRPTRAWVVYIKLAEIEQAFEPFGPKAIEWLERASGQQMRDLQRQHGHEHPNAGPDTLTLGWVRYVPLGESLFVEEIQSDVRTIVGARHVLDSEGQRIQQEAPDMHQANEAMIRLIKARLDEVDALLDGMEWMIFKGFIEAHYQRHHIILPTHQYRAELPGYTSNPVSVYNELPRRARMQRKHVRDVLHVEGLPDGEVWVASVVPLAVLCDALAGRLVDRGSR